MAVDAYAVYLDRASGGKRENITKYVSGMQLVQSADVYYDELTFSVPGWYETVYDLYTKWLSLRPKDGIRVKNTATGTVIFDGFVTTAAKDGKITCRNWGYYLKNEIYLQVTKQRSDTVLRAVCKKCGLTYAGNKIQTHVTMSWAGTTGSAAIEEVIDRIRQKTGQRFLVRIRDKKVSVERFAAKAKTVKAQRQPNMTQFDVVKSASEVTGSVSMDDLVDVVRATYSNSKVTKTMAVAKAPEVQKKYGLLVKYVSCDEQEAAASTARATLQDGAQLTEEYTVQQMIGSDALEPGIRLNFSAGNNPLEGDFWVTSVTHTLGTTHTAALKLEKCREGSAKISVTEKNTILEDKSTSTASSTDSQNVGDDAKRFVSMAIAENGYHERNGWTKYGAWYGMPYAAWCAMFVSWCADRAGISKSVIPRRAAVSDFWAWYRSRGRYHPKGSYRPKRGDLVIFKSSGRSHIAICTGSTASKFSTIEGNASDAVRKKTYAYTNRYLTGFCSPF